VVSTQKVGTARGSDLVSYIQEHSYIRTDRDESVSALRPESLFSR